MIKYLIKCVVGNKLIISNYFLWLLILNTWCLFYGDRQLSIYMFTTFQLFENELSEKELHFKKIIRYIFKKGLVWNRFSKLLRIHCCVTQDIEKVRRKEKIFPYIHATCCEKWFIKTSNDLEESLTCTSLFLLRNSP